MLCIKTSCICDATARLPSLLLATASVNIGCSPAGTCVRPEAVLWQDAVGILAQLLAKGAVLHSLCTSLYDSRFWQACAGASVWLRDNASTELRTVDASTYIYKPWQGKATHEQHQTRVSASLSLV